MKLSKKQLLAMVLGLSMAAPGAALAAEPGSLPDSVLAETGEDSYIVTDVVVTGNQKYSREDILRLVPEATRPLVRPRQLSRQLSLLNDGQIMKIESSLNRVGEQEYKLTLAVEEIEKNHFGISLSNTGNEFTGDYRLGLSWYNADVSHRGDAIGLAYTTSPDEHISDVTQAAFTYKTIFPNSGDSMYFAYGYSNVDMGTIASFGGLNVEATGKGHTASLHYQRNMLHNKAHQQVLDIGFDYKKYSNDQNWPGMGVNNNTDYHVGTLSATYYDITRWQDGTAFWNVGWTTNLIGSQADYNRVRANSDRSFNIFRAGAGYQYRTKTDWRLGIRAYAQWTPNDLITSEQFGAGGLGSVRGFKERVATGDNGFGGSFELYTPEVGPNSRFLLFFDAAQLSNNHLNLGEVGNRNLASFGIGYRYTNEKLGLYASLDYAKPISYGDLDNGRSTRQWTFTLTKTF